MSPSELPDFRQNRILVVGDLMLDHYWHGSSKRISPEAPVPVVQFSHDEYRPGGAGNVALNMAALGSQVNITGLIGDDQNGQLLQKLLEAQHVDCTLQSCSGYQTLTKLRVIAQHQQMLRLDFEDDFSPLPKQALQQTLQQQLAQSDCLVLSDYNKGTLSDAATLIKWARTQQKPIIVDPKGQDFDRYRGASLLTPNRSEFEAIVGPCPDEENFIQKGQELQQTLDLEALLITRGEEGMTLLQANAPAFHLPTQAREVFDVTGAGDTVIATLACALAAGLALPQAVQLANSAAGIVVRKLGTATVTPMELAQALKQQSMPERGVLNREQLRQHLHLARQRGERVIMTNGCFDILHAGHVHYLQQARKLGHRLAVAVNSDASVSRLKGPNRPMNALAERMAVLAALECVDWVVAFDEDTPESLYCHLLPDVIVKGGDYQADQVAGGACVQAAGGRVEILDFLPGHSTSQLIDKVLSRHHD